MSGYTISRHLGSGGMGAVYLAQHPRLNRVVALKVLHDGFGADRTVRDAFDREADLVSRLEHPNIVAVYDRNGPDDEYLWLSMRHIAGGDVADLLANNPGGLALDHAVGLIADTARALDYAHGQGVLHRDIKPSNMLIEDHGDGQRAVLTDFGIARALEDTVTLSGFAVTFAYAAPERLTGSPDADHRADIYSLGCTAFQLLTGRTPFAGDTPAMIHAHIYEPAPSPRQHRQDLPTYLDAVIDTALAKNPADRYLTCSALAADVARALTTTVRASAPTEPAAPPPPPPSSRYEPPKAPPPPPDSEEARLRRDSDGGDTAAMVGLALVLLTRGQRLHTLASSRRNKRAVDWTYREAEAFEALGEAEEWTRRAAGSHDAVELDADGLYSLAELVDEFFDIGDSELWYRRAAEAGQVLAMHTLARRLTSRGELAEAESWHRRGAEAGHVMAMFNLAGDLKRQGELAESEIWYRRVADVVCERSLGRVATKRLVLTQLAELLEIRGEYVEAEGWRRRAVR
ncbi:serine/threonine-protein kinase [Nocardia sp. NPDC058379]|uniref:serine/threonine-protein kinase n=1 Tax=unclassified Nocardia TaxID=2637762 RepID=UPI00364762A5